MIPSLFAISYSVVDPIISRRWLRVIFFVTQRSSFRTKAKTEGMVSHPWTINIDDFKEWLYTQIYRNYKNIMSEFIHLEENVTLNWTIRSAAKDSKWRMKKNLQWWIEDFLWWTFVKFHSAGHSEMDEFFIVKFWWVHLYSNYSHAVTVRIVVKRLLITEMMNAVSRGVTSVDWRGFTDPSMLHGRTPLNGPPSNERPSSE